MATLIQADKRQEIDQLVTVLAEAFRAKVSDAMFTAYEIGLEDLPLPAINRAVSAALRQSRFMPTVAELRELAGEVKAEDRAVLAFGVLDKAVLKHGSYRTVQFDDPVLNATVHDLGGWEKVCETNEAEWFSFFRKRFIDTYQAYARRGVVSSEQARPLIGYFNRTNGFNGYAPQEVQAIACGLPPMPVRIGGPQPIRLDVPKQEQEQTTDQIVNEIARIELKKHE